MPNPWERLADLLHYPFRKTFIRDAGMVGLDPKWVRLDPKLDKSGTISDQISVHLARLGLFQIRFQYIWLDWGPIWPTLEPNLPSLARSSILLTHWPHYLFDKSMTTLLNINSNVMYLELLFSIEVSTTLLYWSIWYQPLDQFDLTQFFKNDWRDRRMTMIEKEKGLRNSLHEWKPSWESRPVVWRRSEFKFEYLFLP